jgi:S-adenosylmethionine:tRNA ribosyltransferase-isomerase
VSATLAFELPASLEAHDPPEARSLTRDGVRLLVAEREHERVTHAAFRDLVELLTPGDLLVVNDSATLPAALDARRADGHRVRLHLSTPVPGLGPAWRVIEVRSADGGTPQLASAGETITAGDGATFELVEPYGDSGRLHVARLDGALTLEELLARRGRPIRYGYADHPWPLDTYQNVYATAPGSSEMPSAGRPLSVELIVALAARGVMIAPITLHCGVSSPERHESPFPEPYTVTESTARLVNATRAWGGRVIAVGTTVVRALETVVDETGAVHAGDGWSHTVITPDRGVSAVDGLITGWHEPEASHLQMLEAIAGPELLARSYEAALAERYLWHEFGDSHLILP